MVAYSCMGTGMCLGVPKEYRVGGLPTVRLSCSYQSVLDCRRQTNPSASYTDTRTPRNIVGHWILHFCGWCAACVTILYLTVYVCPRGLCHSLYISSYVYYSVVLSSYSPFYGLVFGYYILLRFPSVVCRANNSVNLCKLLIA